jgi:hypothetical protein
MHSPVAPDELVAAIQAEVAAGAAWVKIIGDCPEWGPDGPMPESTSATYDLDTVRQAVDAAHAAGAMVAVHNNLPDSGLVAIGADSIEHGTGLSHPEIQALGARGGAWTPTLCAVLHNRDSPDPEVRKRTDERRERLRELLPYAVAHDVRVLAGTDVVGTIAEEIALLVDHGLTVGQAISAAGSLARDFLGIHPEGDIVTYDDDPLQDPGVLAHPAAVVVRGVRVRLSLRLRVAQQLLGALSGRTGPDARAAGLADQAQRARQVQAQVSDAHRIARERLLDPSQQRRRVLLLDPGCDHHELVAADPGDDVRGRQAPRQPRPHGPQHLVADSVAVRVVDPLEAVEIAEDH